MANNGDNKATTATVKNGDGVLFAGESLKKIVGLNTAELDRPNDTLDGEVKGLTESVGEKKGNMDSKAIGSAVGDDDDVQKKIRRAERFGVSVKLTEEEKRNSRAERFGTVASVNDSKKAEELKRKARSDRFGVSASTSTTDKTEEEAKKKARLARFGEDAKANTKGDTKIDSAEEDKRKARTLRFSKPASDSASDLPVKQNIGKEAAVSGNGA